MMAGSQAGAGGPGFAPGWLPEPANAAPKPSGCGKGSCSAQSPMAVTTRSPIPNVATRKRPKTAAKPRNNSITQFTIRGSNPSNCDRGVERSSLPSKKKREIHHVSRVLHNQALTPYHVCRAIFMEGNEYPSPTIIRSASECFWKFICSNERKREYCCRHSHG